MAARHTAAWPLTWLYVGLIVYASLYPFEGWRSQGIAPWSFLLSPLPRYWTGFDVVSNVLGYAPIGFLACVAVHRLRPRWPAVLLVTSLALVLSFLLESLQMFLPMRVPSNVDLGLNLLGAWSGALLARVLAAWGWVAHWSRWRDRWFVADASGVLVLLALWPLALLFPVSVPFGLGQVFERLEAAVAGGLEETPWIDWLPMREVDLQPLLPINEVLCIGMGVLLPGLLAFSVLRTLPQRVLASTMGLVVGVMASSLSAALTYGPAHAWDWIGPEVLKGLLLAVVASGLLLRARPRACLVLALVGVVWQLSMLNQASADVYFAQTLQNWEQGRFIRFHGLIQWLGWLWPYVLLFHLVRRLSKPSFGPG
ncbi:MAG: VanZ family protein [Limnohabitans sp.]